MSDPCESQQGGDDDHAPHGFFPTQFPKHAHRDQVERQRDHDAGAFSEIGCKTFSAGAAQYGQYLENVEDKYGANGR